jgi:hypothetical protein
VFIFIAAIFMAFQKNEFPDIEDVEFRNTHWNHE